MATARGEGSREVKKKARPQNKEKRRARPSKSQRRARGFVNAPLTTVLRFIHPPPRLARPPSPFSPVQHVGSKEVAFTRIYARIREQAGTRIRA